jgi:hypothetical protein
MKKAIRKETPKESRKEGMYDMGLTFEEETEAATSIAKKSREYMWRKNKANKENRNKPYIHKARIRPDTPDTHKSRIYKVLCLSPTCDHRYRDVDVHLFKCTTCKRTVQPADSVIFLTQDGGHLYDCYRPPRPLNMSPVTYRRKYGCVDKHFTRITNGRYYCNPAHCTTSWKHKETRDKHLKMAYNSL